MKKLIKLFSMLTIVISLVIPTIACTSINYSLSFSDFPPWPKQKDIVSYQNDIIKIKNYIDKTLAPERDWVKENKDDASSTALLNYYDSLINSDNAQIQDDNYQILVLEVPGGIFTPKQKIKAYKVLLEEIADLTLSLNKASKVLDFLKSDKVKLSRQRILAIKESNEIKPKSQGVNFVRIY